MNVRQEIMSDEFAKFHLDGLPFGAVLHCFSGVDRAGPHDHPFGFTTHILKGGYVERIYHIDEDGTWQSIDRPRRPGTAHRVAAECIHEIVALPDGECWTLILPEPATRETRFWRFDGKSIASRAWHEHAYTPHL